MKKKEKHKAKVFVVITARPSYARVKTVLQELQRINQIELSIVLAGSAVLREYGDISEVLTSDGLNVAYRVHCMIDGNEISNMPKSTALLTSEISTLISNARPDLVVTIADRFETLATAVAASFQHIPLVHIQGGESSGSIDDKVRNANTMLADYHFPATSRAESRLVQMGIKEDSIFNLGCPSVDLIREAMETPLDVEVIFDKYTGVGKRPSLLKPYVVVMQHSVTSEAGDARRQIRETLNAVADSNNPAIWFWPNIDQGSDDISSEIRRFRERVPNHKIFFIKNMSPEDFLQVLLRSACLIGNSSVGIRECAFAGLPVVNVGSRQNNRERAENVLDVPCHSESILEAIKLQTSKSTYDSSTLYGDGYAGANIAKRLALLCLN